MTAVQENRGSTCAKCNGKTCFPMTKTDEPLPPLEKAPPFCPMRRLPEAIERAECEYEKPNIREFARLCSIQESECYEWTPEGIRTRIPRLEETIQLAQKCHYTRLGIAFCGGLLNEARMLSDILEKNGFEVVSVNCKLGRVPKESIGLTQDQKIFGAGRVETMCNPIAQAEVLNDENVDLAILLGLCVGHDTLFIKYAEIPVTVLAVKDRVTGHNPLAALYLSKSGYYGRLRRPVQKRSEGEKVRI